MNQQYERLNHLIFLYLMIMVVINLISIFYLPKQITTHQLFVYHLNISLQVGSCITITNAFKLKFVDTIFLLQPTSNSVELCRNYEYVMYMYALSVKFKR